MRYDPDTELNWFLFLTEPSFVISHGPRYQFENVLNDVLSDFKSQARANYFGKLSYSGWAGWNEPTIPVDIHNFVTSHSTWGERTDSGSFFVSLATPNSNYDAFYHHFDNLRFRAEECDEFMTVIETVSSIIRYASNMRQWLGMTYRTWIS